MLGYKAEHGVLPTDSHDAAGQPLLSWRVQLLAHIDRPDLHEKFRFDEPWDSGHNLALAKNIPYTYQSPYRGRNSDPTRTPYVRFTGKGTPFPAGGPLALSEITDGPENTIAIIEVGSDQAVIWTMPDDIRFDSATLIESIGVVRKIGRCAAFFNGDVSLMHNTTNAGALIPWITPAGSEKIDRRLIRDTLVYGPWR